MCAVTARLACLKLQGSRFFSKRKIAVTRNRRSGYEYPLQGSRFFSKRKIALAASAVFPALWLQWSRFFSKRKITEADHPSTVYVMELQWSRFFSKRKIRQNLAARPTPVSSFNGAAFFQSGKFANRTLCLWQNKPASMEPLFFKAENYRASR